MGVWVWSVRAGFRGFEVYGLGFKIRRSRGPGVRSAYEHLCIALSLSLSLCVGRADSPVLLGKCLWTLGRGGLATDEGTIAVGLNY